MFMVLLKFAANKSAAGKFMEDHKQWVARGFEDGVFLLVGSLKPEGGGGILAHNTSLPALQKRVEDDPFVAEGIVEAEIVEIAAARADPRLNFLLDQAAAAPA